MLTFGAVVFSALGSIPCVSGCLFCVLSQYICRSSWLWEGSVYKIRVYKIRSTSATPCLPYSRSWKRVLQRVFAAFPRRDPAGRSFFSPPPLLTTQSKPHLFAHLSRKASMTVPIIPRRDVGWTYNQTVDLFWDQQNECQEIFFLQMFGGFKKKLSTVSNVLWVPPASFPLPRHCRRQQRLQEGGVRIPEHNTLYINISIYIYKDIYIFPPPRALKKHFHV